MPRSTGEVTERPWGLVLAGLGVARFSGLLTVDSDGKEFSISFDLGRVVGATSPIPSDAAVRIALTNHFVSSSQVPDLNRRIAAATDRDEIDVLAELAQLAPEVADKLRHRLVAQRAARTFSIEQGTYTADERIAMPPGADLDVREVIYLGARMNLTEQRLAGALRGFGAVFKVKPESMPLDQFGFTDEEIPIITSLLEGASLPELEAAHRDVDPRMVQAIVYALLSSGACKTKRAETASVEYSDGPEMSRTMTPTEGTYSVSRTQTGEALAASPVPRNRPAKDTGSSLRTPAPPPVDDAVARIAPDRIGRSTDSPVTGRVPTADPAIPRAPTRQPTTSRAQSSDPIISRTPTGEPITSSPPMSDPTGFRSASGGAAPGRTTTPRPALGKGIGLPTIPKLPRGSVRPPPERTSAPGASSAAPTGPIPAVARTATGHPARSRTQALIAARTILVEQAADYFTLLGVPFGAPIEVIQTAYLNLVRQLHPDKLDELGVPDLTGHGQRLFNQIGLAFSVLTDPVQRAAYVEKIAAPPSAVDLTSRTRTADDIPATPAGDAYRRGESALRRDEPADAVLEFARACALEPNNVDFHAMLGWAQFCAARDKITIAPETRKALERAIQRSAKPTQSRFLLGRVERMLGRDVEALGIFQVVVESTPNHAEAAAEIRAIEARLARSTGKR